MTDPIPPSDDVDPLPPVVDPIASALLDHVLLNQFAAAALTANVAATPAQLFDKAAAMVVESRRRRTGGV